MRDLGRVSRLTTGAIGVPGRRRFYIETDTAAGAYWFLLEKQQVAALAERAMVILSERAIRPPSTTEPGDEVQEPTHVEFRVGDIELAYSRESDLVDITLHPAEDDAESVRFEANLRQLGKMATAGFATVAAGRPLCPRCSLPGVERRPSAPHRMTGGWQPRVTEVVGRFTTASNATLLASTDAGERVVYKPIAGERPLWDFPDDTLAAREVLTHRIDQVLGLGVVPETAMGEGPFGPGSVQRFVDVDPDFDAIDLVRRADAALWPVAFLDIVVNNADRKIGHLLRSTDGIVAIDHGLTFHPEDKLRTVLWGFAGRRIPIELAERLERLSQAVAGDLGDSVESLLDAASRRALAGRVADLMGHPVHPLPPDDRHPVPWPPY